MQSFPGIRGHHRRVQHAGKGGSRHLRQHPPGRFPGTLYPVNPKAKSILSVKTFPSITAISDKVDQSIIILPPKLCVQPSRNPSPRGSRGSSLSLPASARSAGRGGDRRPDCFPLQEGRGPSRRSQLPGVINPIPDISLNASFSKRMPIPATSPSSPRAGPSARRSSISPRTGFSVSRNSSPSATRRPCTSWTSSSTCTMTSTRR